MRRIVFLILCVAAAGGLAACGEEAEDPAASWKRCDAPMQALAVAGDLESLRGCQDLGTGGNITILSGEVTSLEPLSDLKRVGALTIESPVMSLSPLMGLEVVGPTVTLNRTQIPYCAIKAWADTMQARGNTLTLTINDQPAAMHPQAGEPCP